MELLQNADDAGATETSVEIRKGGFVFTHNHCFPDQIIIGLVDGIDMKELFGTDDQSDKFIFEGRIHESGAEVHIRNFEGRYKDTLDVRGFD